jgi:hypothetical protein
MNVTVRKQHGKITFFKNSLQVYPKSIFGNQAYFSDGQIVFI